MLEHSPCGSESFGEQASYIPSVMLDKDKRALAGVASAFGHNFVCSSEIRWLINLTSGTHKLFSVVAVVSIQQRSVKEDCF